MMRTMRTIENITMEEIRDEIKREIQTRQRVYPRWIENRKIDATIAANRVLILQANLALIEAGLKKNAAQKELFE